MRKIVLSLLFLFIVFFSFSQIKLDSGLVAYYPFNGNANDSSGNGNNPVFNNATLTNDYFGHPNSAYHFNGVDNYIEIPNSNSLNTGNQISIYAWVKPTGFYYGQCHGNDVISKGDKDFQTGNYYIRFDDAFYTDSNCNGGLPDTLHETYHGNGTVLSPVQDTPFVQKNTWHIILYTYDGIDAKLYIDCKLILDNKVSGLTFLNASDLFFGRLNDEQFPYWLNGDLDEVSIYNRVLTDQEIAALCPSGILAVTLTNFAANIINKQIKLDWNVVNEDDIVDYAVQRSITDHSDFITIGTVPAKKLTSYSFVHNTAKVNQQYYYRLAIRENSNTLNYSSIKTAKLITDNKFVIVYPNPSKGNIAVKMSGYNGKATFTLINSLGQLLFTQSEPIIDDNPIMLNLKESKGIYWLKIETNNETSVQKIIIN